MGLPGAYGDPPLCVFGGLRSADALAAAVAEAIGESRRRGVTWHAASDMRACHNPTRMRAIERAASDLAERATTRCPDCRMPGFGVVDVVRGLPCLDCGAPTSRPRALVHGCVRCPARREVPRPDGLPGADPGTCEFCNP